MITLDELPATSTAGQAFSIGFTVRQHGKTLRSDLAPIVRFDRSDAQESFHITAQRQGAEGHYAAEIKFPSAGQWNWHVDIEQFGMVTQPMPALSVQAAQDLAPAQAAQSKTRLLPLDVILNIMRAVNWILADEVDTATAPGQAVPLSLKTAQAAPADRAALGKALFVAKGCTMCHQHDAVNKGQQIFWSSSTPPPDLTVNKYSADYLRSWLKDPAAIKPKTQMPNLNLKLEEIEALIAFLQAKP